MQACLLALDEDATALLQRLQEKTSSATTTATTGPRHAPRVSPAEELAGSTSSAPLFGANDSSSSHVPMDTDDDASVESMDEDAAVAPQQQHLTVDVNLIDRDSDAE